MSLAYERDLLYAGLLLLPEPSALDGESGSAREFLVVRDSLLLSAVFYP